MKLTIISGSTRQNSASFKVSKYIQKQLNEMDSSCLTHIFDLSKLALPMWDGELDISEVEKEKQLLQDSDGFVFVIPEWHGMVPPAVKNLFFLFSGVFRHKPAYLVSVSSGTGGRYPLAEMRATSYKNSFINYLPVNTIIDRVNSVISDEGEYIAEKAFVAQRLDEGLQLLLVYSDAFVGIRNSDIVQEKRFPNGV